MTENYSLMELITHIITKKKIKMAKTIFNSLIGLEYQDDFSELSDEENEKYFSGNLLRSSFQNKEKHILLSISKNKDSLFNRFISVATVISSGVSHLENSLQDFQLLEEYETSILDLPSITESFSYVASDKGIKQYGELSVFKYKKAIYVIYCICRFGDKDEHKKIFKEFRDSFTLVNS